uniref:CRAL-TRIO domain-containing protein n=1 Tax=Heterorhabditis bacteriophora TaxID=37862 RepID=A0A1I7XD06_HETBA
MNNKEKSAVEFLKSETKDLLTSKYGTDYNLLRWAQFKQTDVLFYDLDNVDGIEEHEVLKKYFPIGLVGKFNFSIMSFYKHFGLRSYILYLAYLGPYRILWASVYTNYPEWISQMFIINAPSFMTILWKAIGPLLPERTRSKIKICSANSDWKELIQKVYTLIAQKAIMNFLRHQEEYGTKKSSGRLSKLNDHEKGKFCGLRRITQSASLESVGLMALMLQKLRCGESLGNSRATDLCR